MSCPGCNSQRVAVNADASQVRTSIQLLLGTGANAIVRKQPVSVPFYDSRYSYEQVYVGMQWIVEIQHSLPGSDRTIEIDDSSVMGPDASVLVNDLFTVETSSMAGDV